MSIVDRRLIRIACRVQAAYRAVGEVQTAIDLPEREWNDVLATHGGWLKARRRDWQTATTRRREALIADLDCLVNRLRGRMVALQETERREPPALRELYADLTALAVDFDDLKLDGRTLAVTTEPIMLEGIKLGPFCIQLRLDRLDEDVPYSIEALEPHPAASSSETTHPHVNGQRLCPGEGRAAIRAALAEGRLFDFFTVVDRVLHTYAAGSAYVELDRWYGAPCHDCGGFADDDDGTSCSGCEERLCEDCYVVCSVCSENLCSGCSDRCGWCEEPACGGCLVRCRRCRRDVCSACREDDLCEPCREKLEKEEADAEEESETTSDISAAGPQPPV